MSSAFPNIPRTVPKSQLGLLICVVLTSMANSCIMGYDSMMMNSLYSLPQFSGVFTLNSTTVGLYNASMWMGNILSCLVMQPCADKLGRRPTLVVSACICLIGVVLQSASQNIAMFIVSRIVLGFGVEVAGSAAPLLVGEISPTKYRGLMLGIYFTFFQAGSLVASGVTYGTQHIQSTWAWRVPSILQIVPSLISVIMLIFVPESPRFMVSRGKIDYARDTLKVANNIDNAEAELLIVEIEKAIALEANVSPWTSLFKTKPNIHRVLIVISLALMLELGGSSVVSYYLTFLLEQAGITSTKTILQINIIMSSWTFFWAVVGASCFDFTGRKLQSFVCMCGMIISFFVLGGFVKTYSGSDNTSGQYATVFWMGLFSAFYNFAFTPMNCLYPTEIFPYKTRASGTTVFKFFNCGFGLLASFVLSFGMDNLNWKFYILNAGYDILFLPCIYFLWVETSKCNLEDIAIKFGDLSVDFIESPHSESDVETEEVPGMVSEKN
ncbi:unnamed protein product [Kuraishia capsulata CBS 1993]|uniref:Major facilitator superfamily (MFS) profile domain-containing protein n=1 Tax=Kuraishia capsulata CBS 1993 TaxID=1382522 RepID=W6MHX7_9ASCO|nr:uncharacterized protein KUCA_T00001398001 [Kuraishia capsulata CBS 1993]CDK25428.1 unnamed protein product [Kuraishia capsulata CBS 1993]